MSRYGKAELKRSIRRTLASIIELGEPPESLIMDDGTIIDIENFTEEETALLSLVEGETLRSCARAIRPKTRREPFG